MARTRQSDCDAPERGATVPRRAPNNPAIVKKTLTVEDRPIESVTPYARNPRKNAGAVSKVAASLKEFGWRQPIVVDEAGVVIVGHTRLLAAQKLGMTTVPVHVAVGLTPQQAKAYRIADNRTGEEAEWDFELLPLELTELRDAGFDLGLTGFDAEGIADIFGEEREVVEDEVPEPPKVPITSPGDLILLGRHRLLCGDSAKREDVDRVLDGARPSLMFADPPYGVAIGAKNRMLNSFQKAGRNLTDIKDDALDPEALKAQLLPAFINARESAAEDCTYFVTAPQGGELGMMMMMMQEAGLRPRHVLIWKKNAPTFSMGRLDYDYQHEPILLTWRKRHKRPMRGDHKTSVWEIDKPRASAEHPTMKPVALVANALLNNSDLGDAVFDPFLGSGTTLIAAEQLNRTCCGIEISPAYCDVIVARWEALTGERAQRPGNYGVTSKRVKDCI